MLTWGNPDKYAQLKTNLGDFLKQTLKKGIKIDELCLIKKDMIKIIVYLAKTENVGVQSAQFRDLLIDLKSAWDGVESLPTVEEMMAFTENEKAVSRPPKLDSHDNEKYFQDNLSEIFKKYLKSHPTGERREMVNKLNEELTTKIREGVATRTEVLNILTRALEADEDLTHQATKNSGVKIKIIPAKGYVQVTPSDEYDTPQPAEYVPEQRIESPRKIYGPSDLHKKLTKLYNELTVIYDRSPIPDSPIPARRSSSDEKPVRMVVSSSVDESEMSSEPHVDESYTSSRGETKGLEIEENDASHFNPPSGKM